VWCVGSSIWRERNANGVSGEGGGGGPELVRTFAPIQKWPAAGGKFWSF
jgi:hypothetical protein